MSVRVMIQRTIRRSKIKSVIVSLFAIAMAVGFFAFSTLNFLRGYFGPTVVLTEEMLTTLSADSLPLFKASISSDATFDINVTEQSTTTINGISLGTSTTGHFGALFIGEHFLLLKTSGLVQEDVTSYSGVLVASQTDQVGRQAYSKVLEAGPEYAEAGLSLIMDTSYAPWPWFAGLIFEIGLIVFALQNLRPVFASSELRDHPIVKKLERFGDSESIINEIDDEMLQNEPTKVNQLQFTRSWLIYKYGFVMEFARFKDIMWINKAVSSTNGAKSYSIFIWDRSGTLVAIAGTREKHIDAMIAAVVERAPWAVVGYSPNIQSVWQNNRDAFIQKVDERRAQVTKPQ